MDKDFQKNVILIETNQLIKINKYFLFLLTNNNNYYIISKAGKFDGFVILNFYLSFSGLCRDCSLQLAAFAEEVRKLAGQVAAAAYQIEAKLIMTNNKTAV